LKVGAIAGAYYATAKLGLDLAFATTSVTAVWPPTGIALAALVLGGPRLWPGVALGAFLANADTGVPAITVLGITVGNTLEALVGAWLLRRVNFRPALDTVRDVLVLVGLAALVSTMVSASIGVSSLLAGGEIALGDIPSVWRTWWLGDMGGDLIVAPALLVAATSRRRTDRPPGSLLEAGLLVAALTAVSVFGFAQETSIQYVLFPLLIWAALRFWQPGAAAASLIAAAAAVYFTSRGHGPWANLNPDERLLLAQSFVGVAGVSALLLAAVTRQRQNAEGAARRMASTLQDSLLAPDLPQPPAADVAAYYRAAGRNQRVGGDFYDLFQAGDGSWALTIGDVCGKGSHAAAMTALARYTLRAVATREQSPRRILTLLNDAIVWQRGGEELCSAVYVRLDFDGQSAMLTVSSGGHPLPIVVRADGDVEQIGEPGLLLGVDSDVDLFEQRIELHPGDAIVLYTDGLTDAFAPHHIVTVPELKGVLARCAGRSPGKIVETIERELLAGSRRAPRDDVAVVSLRLSPAAARAEPQQQPASAVGEGTWAGTAPPRFSPSSQP
jgi:serine phosphatase RsbU (regulator of sigma subunit)